MEALLNRNENFQALAQNDNSEIASGILTLEKVVENNLHFNIPIYQRLYVWKVNQIKTLLEDIKNSFLRNSESEFFLGGIMLSNNPSNQIDLVDGQQRFTTLWLICDYLSQFNSKLKYFTYTVDTEPRIHFSIRDKAQQFLKDKTSFKEYINEKGDIINGLDNEISEIVPLIEGQEVIKNILGEYSNPNNEEFIDLQKFIDFIYTKIQLTYTFIPGSSDMNRVFEAMNNRGKQLEHHELLKSRLLEKIDNNERLTYSLLWDACSRMNVYIEKSIKDVADIPWKNLYGDRAILLEGDETSNDKVDLEQVDVVKLLNKHQATSKDKISLKTILEDSSTIETFQNEDLINEIDYSSKTVRSIISYPAFLLHVLRVYQLNKGISVDDAAEVLEKKLLGNFDTDKYFNSSDNVKEFILLLWKVRVYFDKYIIKWVYSAEDKEEIHEIDSIQISKTIIKNKDGSTNEVVSVQRVEATDGSIRALERLQGMLYHSQEMTTQYWLTPFLYYLVNEKMSNENILKKLELVENALFYSSKNNSKLKERTYSIVKNNLIEEIETSINTNSYLNQLLGTNYPNYIFYKLEYILWKNRVEICEKHNLDVHKWNNFRLTAKNSVEHIFPQRKKEENKHIEYITQEELQSLSLDDKHPLDDFGNLVLLSPGMNSEYSNMPYQQKKGKYDSKIEIDSLKSDIIFKNSDWNWNLVIEHRNEMIELIENYINNFKTN